MDPKRWAWWWNLGPLNHASEVCTLSPLPPSLSLHPGCWEMNVCSFTCFHHDDLDHGPKPL